MLGQELLALGILRVKELLGYREPTVISRTAAHIRGVINLRVQSYRCSIWTCVSAALAGL
jgi:chemotaxis signal transduction protein